MMGMDGHFMENLEVAEIKISISIQNTEMVLNGR